jgi:hypothetical protein
VRKKENQSKRTRFLYLLLFFILVKPKDGQQCFNTCYPKKGTHAVAKPRRTPPPSFG